MIFGANGEIEGVITGDMGVARDGSHKDSYTPGIALSGKYTLFAEGARGSLSKMLIRKLGLDAESRAAEIRHRPEGAMGGSGREAQARVSCSTRWAGRSTTGPAAARSSIISASGWCRSASSSISTTPTPISTRSRSSSAPRRIRSIRAHLEGGKRIAYGARALTEGGFQAIPRLAFPGGALIGCAAGFMNVPRIKG